MPNIEELQRFQFEDFALENTRRGKLTVLGEHSFGAEQGRIVTAPVRAETPAVDVSVAEEPETLPDCTCPDGLSSIYCVSTTPPSFDAIPIGLSDTCYWCGLNPETDDNIELFISGLEGSPHGGGPSFGRCIWVLGFNDQTDLLFKEWDDGNPEGVYGVIDGFGEDSYTATIVACAGEVTPC